LGRPGGIITRDDFAPAFFGRRIFQTLETGPGFRDPVHAHLPVAFADGKRLDKPPAETIDSAIAQYLEGIKFRNGVVRWSYLESLGLKAAP